MLSRNKNFCQSQQYFTSSFSIQNLYNQVVCTFGLYLYFFWQKESDKKANHKMVAKSTKKEELHNNNNL